MNTIQIAKEFQSLVNIFVSKNMITLRKTAHLRPQTMLSGRVSDTGDDWKLVVKYYNLKLVVHGSGDTFIYGTTNTNVGETLQDFISTIKSQTAYDEAMYSRSLIRLHGRAISRKYTSPNVLQDKINQTKNKFAMLVDSVRKETV